MHNDEKNNSKNELNEQTAVIAQEELLANEIPEKTPQQGLQVEDDDSENTHMLTGMCVGMVLGMIFGQTLFGNMATGLGVGMCIGLALGASIKKEQ
ncbi:hypothetical protein LJB77_02560 [Ruminococcaceae bacterium OttesenSCG-928-N02]|nr:hypothetical protein [Ruminococcaceae bacterium OttesenSCG-928-N02]